MSEHRNTVTALAWSRDNRTLASGGNDKAVIIWNADTGKTTKTLEHPTEVLALAFSADGRLLAAAGSDGSVRLWDVSLVQRGP